MSYEFADRLIELRRSRGLSQEDLAGRIGVSRQAVSKWERAESAPDIGNLVALSQLYGLTLDDLVNGPAGAQSEAADEVAPDAEEAIAKPTGQTEPEVSSDALGEPRAEQPVEDAAPEEQAAAMPSEDPSAPTEPAVSEAPAADAAPTEPPAPAEAVPPAAAAADAPPAYHQAYGEGAPQPAAAPAPPSKPKRSHPVRVVLLVLLCLLLLGGIVGCVQDCTFSTHRAWQAFDAHDLTQVGDAAVESGPVKNIQVDWAAGSVVVGTRPDEGADGSAILLTEEGSGSLPESRRMRWAVVGDTLRISYGLGDFGLVGCVAQGRKALEISIPESVAARLGRVDIHGASGTYDIGDLTCEAMAVDLASGKLEADGLQAGALDLGVASGNVHVAGIIGRLDADIASGNVTVDCQRMCPDSAVINLASGNLVLGLPDESAFTVQLDKMSGNFTCGFPQSSAHHGGVYGTAGTSDPSPFDITILSGQVTVQPLRP